QFHFIFSVSNCSESSIQLFFSCDSFASDDFWSHPDWLSDLNLLHAFLTLLVPSCRSVSSAGDFFLEGGKHLLLVVKVKEGSMSVNGISNVHGDEVELLGHGIEKAKYTPMEIENGLSPFKEHLSDPGDDRLDSVSNIGIVSTNSNSVVSAVDVLKTLFFILVWYTFSTVLTLYNKTLLGDHLGKFPAPLLMNAFHFGMQACLSTFITWYWSHRFETTVAMSWRDYFVRVVPTAMGTAMDVNLSNASLVFISVTFATMVKSFSQYTGSKLDSHCRLLVIDSNYCSCLQCKSAAPIFLILFAFAFRLETPSIKLLGIMMVISIGILLTVARETEFEFWGFVFVMLAAVMSGFRWCMTQMLLQKETYGLKNPLTLMSYVAPVMTLVTVLSSLVLDPWHEFRSTSYFNSNWHTLRSCLLMLFGGTLAFFMVLTEYILISVTSAVTVTIAGVVKEAVTIVVAVFYFHDKFTWLKAVGLLIIMIGVGLFNWYKYEKLQKREPIEDDSDRSSTEKIDAKYVILDEADEHEDETR
ncbi:Probable sugar phosphate/phosphate translocator At1g06470, partial [Linum perenne]